MIKSPLRYPGGKSKAINQIVEYLPENFAEFREPFVGGGSVFIYLKQKFPDLKFWINDLNRELFLFWKCAQCDIANLVKEVRHIKDKYTDGKLLFLELTSVDVNNLSDLERAVRFFVLNRITFSGTVESGGFSQEAFHKRFTDTSIERLEKLENILTKDVQITNFDYSHLLNTENKNVFLFLDPPYYGATKSKLYGKDGDLHTSFDHQKFAELLHQCHHPWLITYDNSLQIRENFKSANIAEWELQYGMNNYKQNGAAKGKELFITNYEVQYDVDKKANNKNSVNSALQLSLDI
ncbi:DNA adenine methylase [Komarekiella sp. 'clone 1']|uniref:site-specific DNA-methyltransferase (adenine-specific) n=1 Tax=Komarekiella delphini-convector SJRDD-AB1 TaxID=2593771 RepID=A0AA40SZY4_9NOST|nr:DNA adenine methylase [Komarekiella delphini-convector]MBD6618394.1 DNA adenine methylase [Komarekiella delphini-convector SJRDD-AB1]